MADQLSRAPHDTSDWMLDRLVFTTINQIWGPHAINLFATYQNAQLRK